MSSTTHSERPKWPSLLTADQKERDLVSGISVLSSKTFEFRGLSIEEVLFSWGSERKLVWARGCWQATIVPGTKDVLNPVAHSDFSLDDFEKDPGILKLHRQAVAQVFIRHWQLGVEQDMLTMKEKTEIEALYEKKDLRPDFDCRGSNDIVPIHMDLIREMDGRVRKIRLSLRDVICLLRCQKGPPEYVTIAEDRLPDGWVLVGARIAEFGHWIEVLVAHPSFEPVNLFTEIPVWEDNGDKAMWYYKVYRLATKEEVKSREGRADLSSIADPLLCNSRGELFNPQPKTLRDRLGLPSPDEVEKSLCDSAGKLGMTVGEKIERHFLGVETDMKFGGIKIVETQKFPKVPTKVQKAEGGKFMDVEYLTLNPDGTPREVLCFCPGLEEGSTRRRYWFKPEELKVINFHDGQPISTRPLVIDEVF